jgi:predicted transcriptional regulator
MLDGISSTSSTDRRPDTGDVDVDDARLTAPMEKWGEALDGGFQVLPDILLRCQRELKLSTTDVVVLLHLTMAWWNRHRLPFPRTTTIARRMDVTDRTVQRSIERLKKMRLLYKKTRKNEAGETRVAYDLTPLADRLIDISRTDPLAERRREIRVGGAGTQTQSPAQAQ